MYAKSNEQILDLILVQVKKNNNFQRNYDSQKNRVFDQLSTVAFD